MKEDSSRTPIPLAGVLGCAVLVLFAVNTIDRNRDWSDELALLQKTMHRSPESPLANQKLGEVLGKKGRYAEAEALLKRALEIREQALGPYHPNVAQSLNELAAIYQFRGQYAKAEPFYNRALAIWEKVLGPDHPDLARSLNNLAELYLDMGRDNEARRLLERADSIRESQ